MGRRDSHKSVADSPRERAAAALLIMDMISDFDFPDGARFARAARRIAPRIQRLKERAGRAGIATIYTNDNPGRWDSDRAALLARCGDAESPGADIVKRLAPAEQDYFILKPRHSAFYATPLEELLRALGTRRLILSGVSSHQCVLFTATDAHVRHYELVVPSDCIAAPTAGATRFALKYFSSVLGARIGQSTGLRLKALARR